MRHRSSVAVACAVLVVPATASPAEAMTGSWADGVLTITASAADGDVVIDVYDNRGDELDVLRGGRSTHLIGAVDGTRDVVRCRTGDTVVRADPVDDVSDTCVHVLR